MLTSLEILIGLRPLYPIINVNVVSVDRLKTNIEKWEQAVLYHSMGSMPQKCAMYNILYDIPNR